MGTLKTLLDDGISKPAVPSSYVESTLTGGTLGVTVGCISGVFVLVAGLVIYVIYRKRQQRRKSWDVNLYDIDPLSSPKSAPISRSPSYKTLKRNSCPNIQNMMVHQATPACAPDFILPPERVQPYGEHGTLDAPSPEFCVGIRPDLYRSPSGSDSDVNSLFPSEYGRIWFSVVYDVVVEQLNVTLVKVKELPGRVNGYLRDPFVRIYLLPDERCSKTSRVKKKTLAPIYNELFVFQIPADNIDQHSLRFSVYEVDKRRIRHELGHAVVPLSEIDKTKGITLWRDLEQNLHIHSFLGEINVGLCYLPHNEKLKVTILNGRHLDHLDYDRISGIFVKVQMNHARKPYKSKKTLLIRPVADPTFNESFSFCLGGQHVDSCNFIITLIICPKKHRGNNEMYGKIALGSFMYAHGKELDHWQEMTSQPRSTVTKWHALSSMPHEI